MWSCARATSRKPATPTVVFTPKRASSRPAPAKTPLQEVVHQALRHSEVVESAIESTLADVGKDLPPAGRDGLQHVAVEDVVVEEEHLLVEPLPRVVVVGERFVCIDGSTSHVSLGARGPRRPPGPEQEDQDEDPESPHQTLRL